MTELKTLKDMEDVDIDLIEGVHYIYISEEELKKEAIKWIKSLDDGMTAKIFIKEFFNITEKDLK